MQNEKDKNNNLGSHILWRSRGFYFEDYETSEYKEQSKYPVVKLSLNRISFIFFIFIFVGFIFGSKIIYLALIKKENYYNFPNRSKFK